MVFFQKYKEPIFLKQDSDLERQITVLRSQLPDYSETVQKVIEEDIKILEYGIAGEKRIEYELKNSHMPMYVLHDVYFEHNGLTAQIDYMIFTYKCVFIVECKNLFGKIDINNKGEFTRTVYGSNGYHKEGVYSPITQNERHLELIRAMKIRTRFRAFMNTLSDDYFSKLFIPVVVIANDKTVVNDRYAGKTIRDKIIKSDNLVAFIRKANEKAFVDELSDKEMKEGAESWLRNSKANATDYLKKYKELEASLKEKKKATQTLAENITVNKAEQILCPRCGAPMVKRTARKGGNAGKEFYGCSRFPECRGIVNIK